MRYRKLLKTLTIFFIMFLTSFNSVYALDCDLTHPDPLPSQMLCPFVKIFNLVLIMVGAALLIMIIVGVIKMSTSLGDPKAFQGAMSTWTYALVGLAVILFSFFIIYVLNRTFGLGIAIFGERGFVNALFDKIAENWNNFLESALIYEQN